MRTRSIVELERDLENERCTKHRQQLLKQIWRLRNIQQQEAAISDGPDEQPTASLSTLSTQRKEVPGAATEQAPASSAV